MPPIAGLQYLLKYNRLILLLALLNIIIIKLNLIIRTVFLTASPRFEPRTALAIAFMTLPLSLQQLMFRAQRL